MSNDIVQQNASSSNTNNDFNSLIAFSIEKHLAFPGDMQFVFDETYHRFNENDEQGKAGWYIGSELGGNRFICTFGSWRTGERATWISHKDIAKEELAKKLEELNKKALKEHENAVKEGRKRAITEWESASPAFNHPYLKRKKLKGDGLRQIGSLLLIPLYDLKGNLCSLQRISAETGEKRFLSGIPTAGLFFVIGDIEKSSEVYVAEGWATGASIHISVSTPVVVSFSAHRSVGIGKVFQSKYPNKRIILAAENDKTQKNGKRTSEETAKMWKEYINEFVIFPPGSYGDFSDLFMEKGPQAVAEALRLKRCNVRAVASMLSQVFREPEKITELIHGGRVGVIWGAPGIGKSFIAMEMALCIAVGLEFFGFMTFKKAKILYVEGEMFDWEIKSRLLEISRRYKGIELGDDDFSILTKSSFELDTEERIDLFREDHRTIIEEHIEKADVIFLDNYVALTSRQGGESYKRDAVEWDKLKHWIYKFQGKGKSFVFLMHPTKDENYLSGTEDIRRTVEFMVCLKEVPEKEFDKEAFLQFDTFINKGRYLPRALRKRRRGVLKPAKITTNRGWSFIESK